MNLKTRIASVAAASIFALSIGTAAFAQDLPNTVTQNVGEGTFTASISAGTMNGITYSHIDQLSTGTLTLNINDLRGTYEGWNVTLQSDGFVYEGDVEGSFDIAGEKFILGSTVSGLTPVSGQGTEGIAGVMNGPLDQQQVPLTAAPGSGSGQYTQTLPVSLTIPAESPAGEYVATITVGSTAFPTGGDV